MRRLISLAALLSALAAAQVRKIPSSDQWFPGKPDELARMLDEAFRIAGRRTGSVPPRKQLLGLIAPHAALPYSGVVAASAYSRLDHPPNVIVLALNHSRRIEGLVAPALDAYETPLGKIRVNRDAARALGVRTEPAGKVADHSLENQLPFVQRAAPEAGLIPLYVGELTDGELARAAGKLAARLRQGDVIVASSDLTHYGAPYQYTPFPDDALIPARLRGRAAEIFDRIGSLQIAQFDRFVAETRDNLCGFLPIRLLMAALARWNDEVYLSPVDYMASGELTRDYRVSVGYGALAFYPAKAFGVSAADRAKLLERARSALDRYVATASKARVEEAAADVRDPDLSQLTPLFVTLRKNGRLRGCVGTFAPKLPLGDAVIEQTLAAAAEDPRFAPVTASDAPLSLEISLLTPLKRLANWRDFRLGHGAVIEMDGKAGTLLPQIAAEMGWTREQFLENLSLKAGLAPKAYRESRAVIHVYSAQVFAEPAELPGHAAGGRR
ncbi:MAG: AmmeMemoRadiSam system protein B [Acidobacteriota bacterium]